MWPSDEGNTASFWQSGRKEPKFDKLTGSTDTAVCVIGAGIAGLTTAYLLSKAGIDTIVIDDGPVAGGETARTTAHLTWAIDDRIYRIAKWHGDDHARLALESHKDAVNEIERIVRAEKIDCDFSRLDGFLVEAEESDDDLGKELEMIHRLGFSRVRSAKAPLRGLNGRPAIRFPKQGQFHILKYLAGLTGPLKKAARLYSRTPATDWQTDDGLVVTTPTGRINCSKAIVLATNYPLKSKLFPKLAPYRTYAIGATIPKNALKPMLLWDTAHPYHYVRIQEDKKHDVLIVGGEDHRTGHANDGEERFAKLWEWTRNYFPFAEKVIHQWSGQCFETHDGLALLGRFSAEHPDVFMITGDSGMGMTHCTIGAMLVTDLILGRENPLEKVYDPSRLSTQSIKEAVPELIDSMAPYADWLTGGDVASVAKIARGQGAVIRDGLSKIAVYRDEDGKVHKHSAVCTHMKCVVRFNSAEQTWDCPCHGSRFDAVDGHVINTPAMSPLQKPGQ